MSNRWGVFAAAFVTACGSGETGETFGEKPGDTTSGVDGAGGSDSASGTSGEGSGGSESAVATGSDSGGSAGDPNSASATTGAGGSDTAQASVTETSSTSTTGSVTASATSTTGDAEATSTTGEQCECTDGDLCCDGCHVVAEGCTDAAQAACDLAVEETALFACPQPDWAAQTREWRCPSNQGDDGEGLGCPELGPMGEAVGDFEDPHEDLALKYSVRASCMGSDGSRLRVCVNFENDEFDQCADCS